MSVPHNDRAVGRAGSHTPTKVLQSLPPNWRYREQDRTQSGRGQQAAETHRAVCQTDEKANHRLKPRQTALVQNRFNCAAPSPERTDAELVDVGDARAVRPRGTGSETSQVPSPITRSRTTPAMRHDDRRHRNRLLRSASDQRFGSKCSQWW